MAKDYKGTGKRSGGQSNSLFVGVLIGLVIGLVIALGVAWYISKMPSPFTAKPSPPAIKADPPVATTPKAEEKATPPKEAKDDKPRFTFPDILTKGDEAATDQQIKDAKKSTSAAKETFFLQAGAFQNAPDADNLKARLAMVGIEASIQTLNLPDKGVWHRVRVGPYASLDEVNAMRNQLKQNGVEASLIKVRDADK
jgi:cell division protein FtsN